MKIQVLDHGYVELIEKWGTGREGYTIHDDVPDFEAGIIEAARQSTQGSFRGWEQDEKLLKYLLDNNHNTPFEFAGLVLEVQAPIFVLREWHRHRTQSYNEMSARYSPLPDLYYVPTPERVLLNTGKQGGAVGDAIDMPQACVFTNVLRDNYADCEDAYQHALRAGVPKELARLIMPVGHYTRMRATANLRNWLQFITLRRHPAAQWEIRQYAEAVYDTLVACFPVTMRNWK